MSWFFPGSSHTYQAVPTEEGLLPSSSDRKTFEYDTIFSFKNNARDKSKYKSIFKFDEQKEKLQSDYYRLLQEESAEANGPSCALIVIAWGLNALAYTLFLLTFPITYWLFVHRLSESDRMVVFRLGKMQGVRGPGRVLIFPWLDKYKRVNIQASAFSVPPQQFISSDGGIVEMGAEVYFVITDVATMVKEVADHQDMLRSLSKSMLTKTLTKMTVAKLCKDRRLAVETIAEELNVQVRKWGIHIQQVTLSDPKVLKKPEEKSAMGPILRNMGLKETQEFPSPEQFVRNNYGEGDETSDAEAMNQLASAVGGFVQKCKKEDGKYDFSALGGMMQGGIGNMGSMVGSVPGSQPLKLSDMGSLINPNCASSLQARKVAGPLTIDQKSDWHKCLESIICSDDVQLSSEAMGVYELQVLETEHGTQGFYIDISPVHRSVRVIIDERTPDVSVTITSSDLAGVLQGTLSPLQAYLTGRISAQGDVQKLMFFDKLSSRGHKPGSMFDI